MQCFAHGSEHSFNRPQYISTSIADNAYEIIVVYDHDGDRKLKRIVGDAQIIENITVRHFDFSVLYDITALFYNACL